MADESQFCTFFLDKLFFGIEVEKVQEIIRYHEITKVPLALPEVAGLINLRGQIVTAIDLRRRLDLRDRSRTQLPLNVIVRISDETVSLLVDEIGDVLAVNKEDFEISPDTLTGRVRELIRGAYKLKDMLLLILDIEKLTDFTSVP